MRMSRKLIHISTPSVIGFASSFESPKDTLKNILETGELVINVISESFVEYGIHLTVLVSE